MTLRTRVVVRVPDLLRLSGPVLACALAGATGCAPSGHDPPAGPTAPILDANPQTATRWPFWPVRLRFHPLTRVVTDEKTGELLLEARVEFFDAEGHTSKASGQLRIDLHDVAPDARGLGPLATWSRDLSNLPMNRKYYDVVTRTYLLRLEVNENDLAGTPELRGYFLSADGRQLKETKVGVRKR